MIFLFSQCLFSKLDVFESLMVIKNSKFSGIAAHGIEVAVYDRLEEISLSYFKATTKHACIYFLISHHSFIYTVKLIATVKFGK